MPTVRATISDHQYYEIALVINHEIQVLHVLFHQLNVLVKLLGNVQILHVDDTLRHI